MSFDPNKPFRPELLPPKIDLTAPEIQKHLLEARTALAELNGYSIALPNPSLLIAPILIRESVASSNIEAIHTTVLEVLQGELFPTAEQREPDKEVLRYRDAIIWGEKNLSSVALSSRLIKGIQKRLIPSSDGEFRKQQNKIENTSSKETLYTPPAASEINSLISNWENFVNKQEDVIDPLLKCIIAHYQFEAIHPFLDGNGRTGRILMVLQLIEEKLLSKPILYISGFLNEPKNRPLYYKYLREVSVKNEWRNFILFMLVGFTHQALATQTSFLKIMTLHREFKLSLKTKHKKLYSADLVDHLFSSPVTTPVRLGEALDIHYTTASKYLHELAKAGILLNKPSGKYQLFLNTELLKLLRT